jgi:hypothetical protein
VSLSPEFQQDRLTCDSRDWKWFRRARRFEREPSPTVYIFVAYKGINYDAEFKMVDIDDDDEANAKKFRNYAAECRRLARTASEQDRVTLIEIAEAWIVCAEQAERSAKRHRKN